MKSLAMQKCVVLGGGGFIGTNLCRALNGKVAELRAFGRRQSFPDALEGIQWIPGDFRDTASVAAVISGCDVVFHLVTGSTPGSGNVNMASDLEDNVVSTIHLLEACRAQGVKRVIFVSSGGTVYGIPREVPTPETAATNPICAYGITKLMVEKYLQLFEHLYGLEYRILRVSNPFGPYQTALRSQGVIAAFLGRGIRNESLEIFGDGSTIRDYIFIDDVVDALIKGATNLGHERVFRPRSGTRIQQ